METTINERFTALIKAVNMNTSSFAKSIDKAYTSVESICKSKTKPSYDLLESVFLKYPQLSRDWLLMGEGDMYRTNEQVEPVSDTYLHEHLQALESNFSRLSIQLEAKDRQIEKLLDLLGKLEGADWNQLFQPTGDVEVDLNSYKVGTVAKNVLPMLKDIFLPLQVAK